MVESTRPVQTRDPFDRFDEAINDPRLYETSRYEQPYALPYERSETLHEERLPHEPVPLFLSTYEEESYQPLSEYAFASGHRKRVRVSRIVTAVVAVSAIGGLLALFSIDSTRAVIVNVKASLGGAAPAQFGAAEQEPAQASAQLPPRVAAPASPEPAAAIPDPSTGAPHMPPPRSQWPTRWHRHRRHATKLPPPIRARSRARSPCPSRWRAKPLARSPRLCRQSARPYRHPGRPFRQDASIADELAALLKRAKGLLAIGDITSARLLLERAADAQEAEAALMLAGTYDPQVLGSQDLRSVTPDPATARVWYQKAAELGSADAKRRLGQLQN